MALAHGDVTVAATRNARARRGLVFFDLVDELRRLPLQQIASLFIERGALDYAHRVS